MSRVLSVFLLAMFRLAAALLLVITRSPLLASVRQLKLEMWANAQRGGRPAEYRWSPLLNAAVWLTPTTTVPCSNAAKTRNPLKLPGVPQTNETISAASGPKFTIFFPIVDTCRSCEDIARQSCAMVPRWRFLASFFASRIFSEPRAAHFRPAF